MKKFIYARSAADDTDTALAIPYHSIRSIHLFSATSLRIQFIGDDGGLALARFTINTGKHKEVMKAIVDAQRHSSSFIELADVTIGRFMHPDLVNVNSLTHD
jgi:hypothetical protein|tara:strand:+ start:411 stop:716 length:306 start_codon:yes stop_codon:yes gene_type:complete